MTNYVNRPLSFLALLLALAVPVFLALPERAHAQALTISPNRIIFDERHRKDQVLVNNPSDKEHTYRVSVLKRRMLEDGKYVDVNDGEELPDERFANDLIRISPRSFTLKPKTSQTIRVHVGKPKDLQEGEYRSHLRVQVLPDAQAPSIAPAGRVGINIRVNYGVTIPLIVRHGKLSSESTVASIDLFKDPESGKDHVKAVFTRTGSRSTYGDISIIFTENSGKEYVLKFLPGLSLFYPNPSRTFTIPLDVPEGVSLSKGILKVIYREQESEGGNVIAEGSKTL